MMLLENTVRIVVFIINHDMEKEMLKRDNCDI